MRSAPARSAQRIDFRRPNDRASRRENECQFQRRNAHHESWRRCNAFPDTERRWPLEDQDRCDRGREHRRDGIIERHGQFYVKVLVLEGTVRCYLTNRLGESLLLQPGQILITKPDVTALPEPADFDIAREMKTCLLVREFQPLPSQRRIESEEQKQLNLIAKGTYIPSNLVILGRGTQVTLVNAPSTTPPPKPVTNTGHQSRTP